MKNNVVLFIIIMVLFYSWQTTYLIKQNEKLENTVEQILELSKENKQENNEKNKELKEEIESIKFVTKNLVMSNGDMAEKFNMVLKETEDIKHRTEKLNDIFFEKKKLSEEFPKQKTAYLTFDDGPSKNTSKVLDILKKYNVKATFFVCGNVTDYGKKTYKRIVDEGHAIGNHTYSHDYKKIYSSEKAFMDDFKRQEQLIYKATGIKPQIVRFPGGSNNSVSIKYSDKLFMERLTTKILLEGYQYFDWNVNSKDAEKVTQDKDVIIKSVVNGANSQAAIVLMHDSGYKTTTVEALPDIITKLSEKGYKFDVLTAKSYYVHYE